MLQATESVGASLVIWAACAVNTVLCGMSYLEMALLIRESGGTYSYWYKCYGKVPAFLICWFWSAMGKKWLNDERNICFSDGPSGAAIVGLTFAQYVAAPFYEGCYAPPILLKLIAYATIMLLTIMNSMSVKISNYLQIITMAGKVFGELLPAVSIFDQCLISVLSLISIFGVYNLAIGKNAGLQNAFEGSSPNVAAYAVAFYTCMWSYGGWERVCQCFDEIKNPKRNMPIIISGNISKFKQANDVGQNQL